MRMAIQTRMTSPFMDGQCHMRDVQIMPLPVALVESGSHTDGIRSLVFPECFEWSSLR